MYWLLCNRRRSGGTANQQTLQTSGDAGLGYLFSRCSPDDVKAGTENLQARQYSILPLSRIKLPIKEQGIGINLTTCLFRASSAAFCGPLQVHSTRAQLRQSTVHSARLAGASRAARTLTLASWNTSLVAVRIRVLRSPSWRWERWRALPSRSSP